MVKFSSWIEEIINAYENFGGIAHYSQVYKFIESTSSRELTKEWQATIRQIVESHSSDSVNFTEKEDIFYSVEGKGKGKWGLRSQFRTQKHTPIAYDSVNDEDIRSKGTRYPERKKSEQYRVLRDTGLSRELKRKYENKCQICGKTVIIPSGFYSEGHHIRPLGKSHEGPDIPENIIILCPLHHVEFDYGSIAIEPKTLILRHIDPKNKYNGVKFVSEKHTLGDIYLSYHMRNIFQKQNR